MAQLGGVLTGSAREHRILLDLVPEGVVGIMGFRLVLISTLAALAGIGPAGAAVALDSDTIPPSLVTPAKSSWVVGSQVSQDYVPDCASDFRWGTGQVWVSAYQTFAWRGSDDSGSVTYSLVENTKGTGVGVERDLGTDTSLTWYTTNANQECGGGAWMTSDWDITATDASGNATTNNVRGGLFTFSQENNRYDDSFYATKTRITYSLGWANAHCACWSDRGVRKTVRSGASATLTFFDSRDGSQTHVGLVMHTGPDRGKFRVLINGRLRATVDLYAAINTPRVIVWQGTVQPTDVMKLVNLATPGRPRIDLDGVLTN